MGIADAIRGVTCEWRYFQDGQSSPALLFLSRAAASIFLRNHCAPSARLEGYLNERDELCCHA
jgi:hypothetical protein